MKKYLGWAVIAIIIILLGLAGYKYFTRPLPGEKVQDLGRDHVSDGTAVEYNSNPPTSGPHYEQWTRAGVYDKPISDGHLVHSLEHGYVIMSYNCTLAPSAFLLVPAVYAHEEELEEEPSSTEATDGEELPSIWQSDECKELVSRLSKIYEDKGERKLIVIPRPNLDSRIALTAWGRIEKFQDFDKQRILAFIDAFRDHGPEKTME